MIDDKFTTGPWNSHIREMTGADGETRRKCFIEKNGVALAQFANFGDENEANLKLCASAPDMYELLGRLEDYFQNRHIYGYGVEESVSSDLLREIKKVMKRAEGKKGGARMSERRKLMSEEKVIDEKAEYAATFAGAQAIRAAIAASPRPIPTGLGSVDRMLGGGFEYGNLYVLASAPSMGKTTLAHQIAVSISAHGHDVIYVSLAEDTIDLMIKGISRCSLEISEDNAITTWQLDGAYRGDRRYADFSDAQRATLELARARYAKQAEKLYIVDIPISMDELESIVASRETLTGSKPFVVIDFLQLLSLIGESDKQKRLSISDRDNNNVMRLKRLAFKHKIPILVLTSVCSTSYYTSVSLESLNHSGGIENTADVVLGLQPSKYSFNDSRAGKRAMAETMAKDVRDMSLSCVKNREGKFGKVELRYHAAYNFFEEMK